jgi:hypothetical protein
VRNRRSLCVPSAVVGPTRVRGPISKAIYVVGPTRVPRPISKAIYEATSPKISCALGPHDHAPTGSKIYFFARNPGMCLGEHG